MIKSDEIRKSFVEFFQKNNHVHIESSSLIPDNDPSLLFTNAGMVQFKNWFTGIENPEEENVVTSQKCIRAGGKHNDLDNVGFTPRHHTFFEMLGNFSFGGYFKENAIEFAWKFLTKNCSIKTKDLIITVFKEDEESYEIWKKISGFGNSQIIKITSDDNFWSMGESGPCGPCSEIFYDNGEGITGGLPGTKNQDGERYTEIWNLVFMEYEKKNGKLSSLPKKCVDTGMGLERITAVLNKKINNFETDIFKETIESIEYFSDFKVNKDNLISFRVIADHIRSIIFLISEGIIPSNEGRGYVLRRIVRRASRHLNQIGYEKVLLYKLVEVISNKYEHIYIGLKSQKAFIEETLKIEEEKFSGTLKEGIKLLKKEINKTRGNSFSSEVAFKLYDTYGFPIDMTQTIIKENNLSMNLDKLNSLIVDQKKLSKESWKGSGDNTKSEFFSRIKEKYKSTDFSGYQSYIEDAQLIAIIKNEEFLTKTQKFKSAILIFDKTPFYAESGGQVGDRGYIFSIDDNSEICEIEDTKKEDNVYLHFSNKIERELQVGTKYKLVINKSLRNKARNNHTATHLLHESLRRILGDHIKQKGSLVSPDRLRFDFTNNRSMKDIEIKDVQRLVNDSIRNNLKVETVIKSPRQAIDDGAIGLFGEKYPEKVRVVSMGENNEDIFSSELCGGTHVNFTGEIGSIQILSETSISSGVRRIEAITGEEVENYSNTRNQLISELKNILNTNDENILSKMKSILKENQNLQKKEKQGKQLIFDNRNTNIVKGIKVYIQICEVNPKELKSQCDLIKEQVKSGIIVLVTNFKNKSTFVISVTKDHVNKYNALILVREISTFLGGKGGGGREDMAQGGGLEIRKPDSLKQHIMALI
ncbi:alanine--tRNA ligase [Rickettsiales bacterium]|nr:alanine--tRNA ligase [Rickettsiales bacterium]